jgi:hypothetical protein
MKEIMANAERCGLTPIFSLEYIVIAHANSIA